MKTKVIKLLSLISLLVLSLTGCEDAPPNEYLPETFVEAFLIVDEPISSIIVMRSQPVADSFDYNKSYLQDAEVVISEEGGNDMLLSFRSDTLPGYFYQDTSYKVKPETLYNLRIRLNNGSIVSGKTKTPSRMTWLTEPKNELQYPLDSLKLPSPDSLRIQWSANPGTIAYLIRIVCLDTLDYGKYLLPPTEEKNRRITRPFDNNSRFYNDITRWAGPIPNTQSPVVWNGLKWYGMNEVSIYAPDENFIKWFIHFQRRGQYEPLLESVDGAMGVFGSAARVSKVSFVRKNQP